MRSAQIVWNSKIFDEVYEFFSYVDLRRMLIMTC